jgi:ATP-dependent RNA helicase DeaD
MTTSFEELGLKKGVLSALDQIGYETPTEIQADGIRPMLQGLDLVAQAPTGTGKTAAFGCLLADKTTPGEGTQALVLTPTRELCRQVAGELERLCSVRGQEVLTIYGGVSYNPQIQGLKEGAEIVVGTPGRVKDLIQRGSFDASLCDTVVLDEADRMLDMGFIDDVSWIIDQTSLDRQSLLFSATIPPEVDHLADEFCHRPVSLEVGDNTKDADREEYVIEIGRKNKAWALERILESEDPELAFVFCATRHQTQKIANLLDRHGYDAKAIHGGLSQSARERTMEKVRKGQVRILVGTNVLARGIDVRECELVVNYDTPQDPEDYIHRVGRTARMEDIGAAYTLATRDDSRDIVEIEGHAGAELETIEVPDTDNEDQLTRYEDWQENADPFGNVHLRLTNLPEGEGRMDMFWDIAENASVSRDDLGNVEREGDALIVRVHHNAASDLRDYLNSEGLLGKSVTVDVVPPSQH